MGDLSNQARHYINFGPISAAGISTSAGAKQLLKVQKADWKDDRKAEAKKASGVRQGAGIRRTQGGGTITLSIYRELGPAEVNWLKLQDDEKMFTYTLSDENGVRINFTCTVSSVSGSSDENSENMFTVELAYTKRYSN
jgi:hypothetical protein